MNDEQETIQTSFPNRKLHTQSFADWDELTEWLKYPAVTSRGELYLILGNEIVGKVRMSSAMGGIALGTYGQVCVDFDDDRSREFFKDDPGIIDGHLYSLCYNGITGEPLIRHAEDEGRHKNTRIVDSLEFDFGITHPFFSSVEGFGSATKTNHLRVNVPQKHRRPRNSNKIKKVK